MKQAEEGNQQRRQADQRVLGVGVGVGTGVGRDCCWVGGFCKGGENALGVDGGKGCTAS